MVTELQRFKEIDLLKGMGIVLMIMGHQYFGLYFDKWIHAFHMPMFFIISGFLYRKPDNVKSAIQKKVKTLIVPYIFFAIVHLIIICIKDIYLKNISTKLPFYLYHILFMNTEGIPICGAIWFLTAIFFTYMMFVSLDFLCHDSYLKVLQIATLTLLGFILSMKNIRLPLSFDISLVCISLFFAGYILRKLYIKAQINQNLIWIGLLGVFFSTLLIFINGYINLRLAYYGNPILFLISAICMTISLYFICKFIVRKNSIIIRELIFVGKNSIVYMGFNQLVLFFLNKISFSYIFINVLIKIISLIISLIILHIISNTISNSVFKTFIGK